MVSMLGGCLCRRSPRPLSWEGSQQQGNEEWHHQVFRLGLLHGGLWVGTCFVLHKGTGPGKGESLRWVAPSAVLSWALETVRLRKINTQCFFV